MGRGVTMSARAARAPSPLCGGRGMPGTGRALHLTK